MIEVIAFDPMKIDTFSSKTSAWISFSVFVDFLLWKRDVASEICVRRKEACFDDAVAPCLMCLVSRVVPFNLCFVEFCLRQELSNSTRNKNKK